MGKVKDTSYFVVQGWMLNQLHLKGNTLQVFAIIHGFSHSEDNEYKGSRPPRSHKCNGWIRRK